MSDWLPFIAGCPVIGCKNASNSSLRWVHANCGKPMFIGRTAQLKCEVGHVAHMRDWLFNCGAHNYQKGSTQGFFDAISLAGRTAASNNPSQAAWYQNWAKDVVLNL